MSTTTSSPSTAVFQYDCRRYQQGAAPTLAQAQIGSALLRSDRISIRNNSTFGPGWSGSARGAAPSQIADTEMSAAAFSIRVLASQT